MAKTEEEGFYCCRKKSYSVFSSCFRSSYFIMWPAMYVVNGVGSSRTRDSLPLTFDCQSMPPLIYSDKMDLHYLSGGKECHTKVTALGLRRRVIGSTCNGLVLLFRRAIANCEYHVINPLTRRTLMLPIFPLPLRPMASGLAFETSSGVYKAVVVYGTLECPWVAGCAILTVGVDKAWRLLDCAHLSEYDRKLLHGGDPPVTMTNFVYWGKPYRCSILALDLKFETMKSISLPHAPEMKYSFLPKGDSLSVFSRGSDFSTHGWLLKDYISEEWVKILYIESQLITNELHRFLLSNKLSYYRGLYQYDYRINPTIWFANGERIIFDHIHNVGFGVVHTFVYDLKTRRCSPFALANKWPPVVPHEPFICSLVWVS